MAKGRQVAGTATGQITIVSLLLSRGDGGWGVVLWLMASHRIHMHGRFFPRANEV